MSWSCRASSWRPRRACGPSAAVVLNLSPDHLDRYPDYAAYVAAKARIYQGAEVAVVNRDDAAGRGHAAHQAANWASPWASRAGGRLRPAGPGRRGLAVPAATDRLMPAAELLIPGRHNLANALAALALAQCLRPAARRPCWRPCVASPACPIAARWWASRTGCAGTTTPRGPTPGPRWRPWTGWWSRARSARVVLIAGRRRQGRGLRAPWPRRWRGRPAPWS